MIIKTLRKKTGLTQSQFGKKIGVTAAAISEYETGKSMPSHDKLRIIARELNISIDSLLGGDSKSAHNEPSGEITIGNIRSIQANIGEHIHALPLISIKAQASIIERNLEGNQLRFIEDTYPVYLPEGVDQNTHYVFEIEGDSMEPDIKNRAKVLAVAVKPENIKYESGAVYAVLFANRFVVKRIKTNDLAHSGILVLHSDNERYGKITVNADDIRWMWKVIRIVDSPVY
jgi:transcriptional regulator with XRE-family HTH domain